MKDKRKIPKSWERQLYFMRGYKKSYRKARFIKARKRYWMAGVMSWAHPEYMTKDYIESTFYRLVEMRV